VQIGGEPYKMNVTSDAHGAKGTFDARDVTLAEDFTLRYKLDPKDADSLAVITYRDPDTHQPNPTEMMPTVSHNEPGFFEALAVLGMGSSGAVTSALNGTEGAPNLTAGASNAASNTTSRTIVVLFDNSLSMQWEKLERSYFAMEQVLHALRPNDRFNLLMFNQTIASFQPAPIAASRDNVQKAVDFVRASKLRGGTDVQQALTAALAQFTNVTGENYIVLLSDGGATRGTVANGKLAKWYAGKWAQLPQLNRPRTYVFGVGDDANLPLLRMISRRDGTMENVLSTEPIEFKLNSFISKIGRKPVAQLALTTAPESAIRTVYPLQDSTFGGSIASWVGQYTQPNTRLALTMRGVRDGSVVELKQNVSLPQKSLDHPELPRLWAQARVDALLEKIARDGEDQKSIDEIIALSRRYKFVTPYTSFLAVPRALLRPRVIRPGDPVLRVHTDESIRSVIAIFPFGLTKRLRFLEDEQVWQTRFLAPDDMQDGTYTVRLILRDKSGNAYREAKTFVIASKPPVVNIRLDLKRYHPGDTIPLKVAASNSTRTLTARLEGGLPITLHWNQHAGANTGEIEVPSDLPAGNYRLTVIAEDIAHNIGTQEVQIEILP
jgi:Ca-activated chloride channel family protein